MKKIAVILSGCGVFDGSEIHEAVLTLFYLSRGGAQYHCASIDAVQEKTVNHGNHMETGEKRNIMAESARISRGNISNLSQISPKEYDAVIFPGGSGAVLNLCSFGKEGANMTVNADVEKLIKSFHEAKKPIGAICIAPVILAKVLAKHKVKVTIGNDAQTATVLNGFGAEHVNCKSDEICFDTKNLVVTTPAYMTAKNISEAAYGIEKLVGKILSL